MILKKVKRINARNHSQVLIPRMEHEALGHSRAQGYKLLKRVWTQTKDDVDETGIDRLELLSWSIQTLLLFTNGDALTSHGYLDGSGLGVFV